MPTLTTAQRRAHYDTFVADIINLCTVGGVRPALASGRGRPVEECDRMKPYLVARISGFGARQAHYTVASLIAAQRHLAGQDDPYTPESAIPAGDSTPEADSRDADPAGAGRTDRALDTPGRDGRPAEPPEQLYE
ncbi:hypothetical protein ACWGKK_45450, partial [Streptomyces chartreusis]